mmetsp:Transcript_4857/g.31034  ORF Transcript_4857/g.31034 Transcript_4857/m.31034 type:complete len:150 (+) Transcript_4857:1303-1752(+)
MTDWPMKAGKAREAKEGGNRTIDLPIGAAKGTNRGGTGETAGRVAIPGVIIPGIDIIPPIVTRSTGGPDLVTDTGIILHLRGGRTMTIDTTSVAIEVVEGDFVSFHDQKSHVPGGFGSLPHAASFSSSLCPFSLSSSMTCWIISSNASG